MWRNSLMFLTSKDFVARIIVQILHQHHNKYHIYLVVFFDEVETTVIGDESCDLLSVLDELDSDTLTNSRVRLLSLNTNLLENNSLENKIRLSQHNNCNSVSQQQK